MISLQSATTLWQRTMECVRQKTEENETSKPKKKQKTNKNKEKEPAEKVKKIRLFPNQSQKEILKKWFGTARWTYNQCLTEVEKNGTPRTKKDLRIKCLNAEQFKDQNQWVLDTPYDGKI
jgi:DNA-nicking Smr family endonuclease